MSRTERLGVDNWNVESGASPTISVEKLVSPICTTRAPGCPDAWATIDPSVIFRKTRVRSLGTTDSKA